MSPEAVYATRKERLTKLSLALALLLLISISYVTYRSTIAFAESARLVDHTHLVIKQIDQIAADVTDAENAQRGYLITGDMAFLQPYDAVVTRLPDEIALLRDIVSDNPAQQGAISDLDDLISRKMRILRLGIDTLAQRKGIDNTEVIGMVGGEGQRLMYQIRTQVERMVAAEESLLVQRAENLERGTRTTKHWILLGNLLAAVLLLTAFFVVLREIEQHRRTNHELEMSAAQLELTNKELESFSYSVSHDLRSPLRAIDGYSRIFEEDFADRLDQEGLRLLAVIRASSKKMGQLIDDLLSFSRMGRKPVDAAIVDMNLLVNEVWQEVSAENENLLLKKEALPPVFGDRALLRQVLLNLLSNAVKYSGNKPAPVIEVGAEKKGDDVIYSIRDNGVGFDMRFYNKLFGVFQRLHTEKEFPGTGVGLAIAQRVIVRHGGHIWAESELGEYTVFHFSLPIKKIKEAI
ncbi:MAG TPA: CHASE3 domain-containing protein [Oxalicibacterium sp.]|nr:CHASE3 domain-containing protein [Oxalicibacterium sp.]